MNLKIDIYISLLLFFAVFYKNSKAQDPFFSQNLYTRTYLNPAIAGTDSTLVVSGAYQTQWRDIGTGLYESYRFSADQYVHFLRGGLGVDMMNNTTGSQQSNYINVSYAPHFELFRHKLALQPGFSIGYLKTIIPNYYSNSYIPVFEETSKSDFNINAGVFMYTKKLYGGIAVNHLNQPEASFTTYYQLPYKLTINMGSNLSLKKDTKHYFTFSPNLIYMKQQDVSQLLLGITAKYKWFLIGLSYKNDQTFIYNAGLQFRYFKFGFSLDRMVSTLTNTPYPSYEFQLIGFIPYSRKPCKIKTIRFI